MNSNFSKRLKKLRINNELTQKELAETLNVSTVSISSYETGAKTPSFDMVLKIAQKYNVSVDWLCGLSNNMKLNNKITTYKELFQLFITIFDTRYENEENTSVIDNINIEESYVCLTLHEDINFENFFSKWCDIFKLYCERTIDKDLYNMWLEKQLKNFDRPINGAPFELNK